MRLVKCDENGKQINTFRHNGQEIISAVVSRRNKGSFDLAFIDPFDLLCFMNFNYNEKDPNEEPFYNFFDIFPSCIPSNVIIGCPQDFCVSTIIDDFINISLTEQLMFRGQYYWKLNNALPLKFPSSEDARSINKIDIYLNFPDYIDEVINNR